MFCPKCGKEIVEYQALCSHCRATVRAGQASKPADTTDDNRLDRIESQLTRMERGANALWVFAAGVAFGAIGIGRWPAGASFGELWRQGGYWLLTGLVMMFIALIWYRRNEATENGGKRSYPTKGEPMDSEAKISYLETELRRVRKLDRYAMALATLLFGIVFLFETLSPDKWVTGLIAGVYITLAFALAIWTYLGSGSINTSQCQNRMSGPVYACGKSCGAAVVHVLIVAPVLLVVGFLCGICAGIGRLLEDSKECVSCAIERVKSLTGNKKNKQDPPKK